MLHFGLISILFHALVHRILIFKQIFDWTDLSQTDFGRPITKTETQNLFQFNVIYFIFHLCATRGMFTGGTQQSMLHVSTRYAAKRALSYPLSPQSIAIFLRTDLPLHLLAHQSITKIKILFSFIWFYFCSIFFNVRLPGCGIIARRALCHASFIGSNRAKSWI